MSLRIVESGLTGSIVPNAVPCQGGPGEEYKFAQSGVRVNETLQIRFKGTPPFNLTQSVCNNSNYTTGVCTCGFEITTLASNIFTWTVAPLSYNWTNPRSGENVTVTQFSPEMDQSIIWMAIEQNTTLKSVGGVANFYLSPNFTYSSTSYDNPRSAGSKRSAFGITEWGILSLAILGTLLGTRGGVFATP